MEELNHAHIILKGLVLKEGITKDKKPWAKIIISTDQDKYNIWVKKQDGSFTVAFTQLKAFGFPLNKSVAIAFDIKEASFEGRDGSMVEYKDRTIMKFENTQVETLEEHAETAKAETAYEEEGERAKQKDLPEQKEIDVSEIPF